MIVSAEQDEELVDPVSRAVSRIKVLFHAFDKENQIQLINELIHQEVSKNSSTNRDLSPPGHAFLLLHRLLRFFH